MKNKKHVFLALLWACMIQFTSAQISPEAKAVIDAYNKVTGGLEAKNAVTSLVQTGTWEMADQNLKGQMTIYFRHPDSFASVSEVPNVGTISVGVSKGEAWENNSITGFRMLQGNELQQALKEASLFPETNLEKLYKQITVQEPRSDGLTTLLLIDNDGFEEFWYFDPLTHFLIEVQRNLDAGARGSYRIKMTMSHYQPVGDLVIAHLTETSTPAFTIITKVDKTELNTEVPDYVFNKQIEKH